MICGHGVGELLCPLDQHNSLRRLCVLIEANVLQLLLRRDPIEIEVHDRARCLIDVHEVEGRTGHIALHAEGASEGTHKEGLAYAEFSIEADDRSLTDDFADCPR